MDKIYLHYIEGCIPKTKKFDNELELVTFIQDFIKIYGAVDDGNDNWIEMDKIYFGKKVIVKQEIFTEVE